MMRVFKLCLACGRGIRHVLGQNARKYHKKCEEEGRRKWLEGTLDYRRARQRSYYHAHKEEELTRRKVYYEKNRDRILARMRKQREEEK